MNLVFIVGEGFDEIISPIYLEFFKNTSHNVVSYQISEVILDGEKLGTQSSINFKNTSGSDIFYLIFSDNYSESFLINQTLYSAIYLPEFILAIECTTKAEAKSKRANSIKGHEKKYININISNLVRGTFNQKQYIKGEVSKIELILRIIKEIKNKTNDPIINSFESETKANLFDSLEKEKDFFNKRNKFSKELIVELENEQKLKFFYYLISLGLGIFSILIIIFIILYFQFEKSNSLITWEDPKAYLYIFSRITIYGAFAASSKILIQVSGKFYSRVKEIDQIILANKFIQLFTSLEEAGMDYERIKATTRYYEFLFDNKNIIQNVVEEPKPKSFPNTI